MDDADFDLGRHLRQLACPPPGDEQALLELAAAVVTEPLPRSRPLWSAVLVTGLAGDAVALVVVLHHVLADGLGGLAVLARLVDQATNPLPAATFPRPPPARLQLATDPWLTRLGTLGRLPPAWRTTRASIAAAGGLGRFGPPAARCSLRPGHGAGLGWPAPIWLSWGRWPTATAAPSTTLSWPRSPAPSTACWNSGAEPSTPWP